jgi:hypothetical protein
MIGVLPTLQILANGCIWGAKWHKKGAPEKMPLIIKSSGYEFLLNLPFGTTNSKHKKRSFNIALFSCAISSPGMPSKRKKDQDQYNAG